MDKKVIPIEAIPILNGKIKKAQAWGWDKRKIVKFLRETAEDLGIDVGNLEPTSAFFKYLESHNLI
jgi:hypothetical protein